MTLRLSWHYSVTLEDWKWVIGLVEGLWKVGTVPGVSTLTQIYILSSNSNWNFSKGTTLHRSCACSARNSWIYVLFSNETRPPMKWLIREDSSICQVRAGEGRGWAVRAVLWGNTSPCALVCEATSKPRMPCAGGQGQTQNQTDRKQTRSHISGRAHTGQALTCLRALHSPFCLPEKLPHLLSILVKNVPSTLSKAAPL